MCTSISKPSDSTAAIGKTQQWRDGVVHSNAVLRDLRAQARRVCDLPSGESEVTGMEVFAIFVLCYVCHYSHTAPLEVRRSRVMADHRDFNDPSKTEGLPYYVVRTHDAGGIEGASLGQTFLEFYRAVVSHHDEQAAIPEEYATARVLLDHWVEGLRHGARQVRERTGTT